ncbi:hypothetical protein AVEN_146001-1 [Araneus ventricosus]|uniref:Uncharacterized protein n=1 Tax=Araneus ventricosus TaxID=182803 RepID=A0A4Y2X0E4_ARAVE|nr:hypothetical protein AVEN_273127-1 [Araneus ventricosus]GBO42994.1 hypothetical protein AVEN_146001-1 [Araneus ventricosus]
MTRTTPELACPLQTSAPAGGRLAKTYDLARNKHIHGGSSVESGFELGILPVRSRDITTRPSQLSCRKKSNASWLRNVRQRVVRLHAQLRLSHDCDVKWIDIQRPILQQTDC